MLFSKYISIGPNGKNAKKRKLTVEKQLEKEAQKKEKEGKQHNTQPTNP
jgi:hypothetical protein